MKVEDIEKLEAAENCESIIENFKKFSENPGLVRNLKVQHCPGNGNFVIKKSIKLLSENRSNCISEIYEHKIVNLVIYSDFAFTNQP